MPIRRILYISGTRADYGLMRSTLMRINADPRLSLSIIATGMHLDPSYGRTVGEIETDNLYISDRIPVETGTPTGALMSANVGRMLTAFAPAFETSSPDIVLLLGDRGEMLAGAIAALHLNIPAAHIHGGERSGTVDEPVRHAISKLSSLHLVSTEESRTRLITMGEAASSVHVVGAPGIDGLAELPQRNRSEVAHCYGMDTNRPIALLVYHPVLQEAAAAGDHIKTIVESLLSRQVQIIALQPNSDAGSASVRQALANYAATGQLQLFTHLHRTIFTELMAAADVMVGNSSSGIIEAATFGTPVVNIGSRQNLRERNSNVIDVDVDSTAISEAIAAALLHPRPLGTNIYGDGHAGMRIANLLATADLAPLSNGKTNAY